MQSFLCKLKMDCSPGCSFAKNGKYYSMFAWDSDMSEDEWFAIA